MTEAINTSTEATSTEAEEVEGDEAEEVEAHPLMVMALPLVAELAEGDKLAATTAGTIGQVMAAARAKVEAAPFKMDRAKLLVPVTEAKTWTEAKTATEALKVATEAAFTETVRSAAGAGLVKHEAHVKAWDTRRAVVVSLIVAYRTILEQEGQDVSGLAVSSGGGSTGTRVAGTLSYYRIKDGAEVRLTKGSPLSLWAAQVFKCPTDDLRSALIAAGGSTDKAFSPVAVTVAGKDGKSRTVSIGASLPLITT